MTMNAHTLGRVYRCPKHGITTPKADGPFGRAIDRTPHISVTCGPEALHGDFCLICYAEWINATIPRLESVDGDSPDN